MNFETIQATPEQQAIYEEVTQSSEPKWGEPLPLIGEIEPESYPNDALPEKIRLAVEEVQGFVQAPYPLVATCAIGVISLACQAYVDVERARKLTGPVSLFLLTIAESGERKTKCDEFFSQALREYEQEQKDATNADIVRYQAELDSWNAERDGLLAAIKDASKKNNSTTQLKNDLAELQHDKPIPPRIPKILLSDETPENLAWRLAKEWPSAGVVSSEAGSVFGSHGMGKDSLMRNLSLYNVMWDGGTHSIGRRTSESFTVKGARLTTALQVQETTLREFNNKAGILARGTGYFARFLITRPESTQGTRMFAEPPAHWPHLSIYNQRIKDILSNPVPINDEGYLEPLLLNFSSEAKALWIDFHNSIEKMLATGKELYNLRDVASKSADNVARLSALFHVFTHGIDGSIGADSLESACRIVAWHLSESRRFFDELTLPVELRNTNRLDTWLIEYAQRERTYSMNKRYALQHSPLRKDAVLMPALRELEKLERIRLVREGNSKIIKINPALLIEVKQ
ncbi:putative DNA primase/helicase [Nitrosomonas aestuarii]|uniref:Putative DNA primase/helicase n=1 Tax=Nitrosomonas aestuarii TaxID=52441 RepID=A0A1I4EUA3_9PROT|nr:YfjI family protein [Nitrosomonas aestuarii]SFL07721.1 putative DNA primase/helicase [Nitrosomonas aestuarii]